MTDLLKMEGEIKEIWFGINSYINNNSIKIAIDKIIKYLEADNEKKNMLMYLLMHAALDTRINIDNEEDTRHDILCCVAKALNLSPIPNENIYSKNSLYQYNPAKNGKNILKHEISFNDVASYLSDSAVVIIETDPNNNRSNKIYLLKTKENKNIIAVCEIRETLRFITARHLGDSKESIEKGILCAVRDENLDDECLAILRQRATELFVSYTNPRK